MSQPTVEDMQYCERIPRRMATFAILRGEHSRTLTYNIGLFEEGSHPGYRGEIRGSIYWLSREDAIVTIQNDVTSSSSFYTDDGAGFVVTREIEDTLSDRDLDAHASVTDSEYTPSTERYTPLKDLFEESDVIDTLRVNTQESPEE